jgi:mannitol/fructose-specific phosphotransferase system IIA component (Ntr-type)
MAAPVHVGLPKRLVELTVDGQPVAVPEGSTLLDACRAQGLDTPTLCYLETLAPVNVCRVCVVEVEGSRVLVPACSRPVEPGAGHPLGVAAVGVRAGASNRGGPPGPASAMLRAVSSPSVQTNPKTAAAKGANGSSRAGTRAGGGQSAARLTIVAAAGGPVPDPDPHVAQRQAKPGVEGGVIVAPVGEPCANEGESTAGLMVAAFAHLSAPPPRYGSGYRRREQAWQQALAASERVFSNEILPGVVIPHAHVQGIPEPMLFLGISPQGVDFPNASAPARIIFILLSPPDDPEEHLRDLAEVVRLVGNQARIRILLESRTPDDLARAFRIEDRDRDGAPRGVE